MAEISPMARGAFGAEPGPGPFILIDLGRRVAFCPWAFEVADEFTLHLYPLDFHWHTKTATATRNNDNPTGRSIDRMFFMLTALYAIRGGPTANFYHGTA